MKLLYQLLLMILNILACSVGQALACANHGRVRLRNWRRRPQPCPPPPISECRPSRQQPIFTNPDAPATQCTPSGREFPYQHPLAKVKVVKNQARDGTNRVGPL